MSERAIDKIIEELENQAKQAKQDMADARQYGVNSAGFNGYMGRMEMAEQMLDEARRLALEEAKERSQKENVHAACTGAESEQAKEKPTGIKMSVENVGKDLCPYCDGPIAIRNPTGQCDHLYYPDNVNKGLKEKKPTAPVCPTCGVGVKLTERRIDGNSTCFNGHTHKTKDFYRPSTQDDIVGEFREWLEEAKKNGDSRFYNEFKDAEEIIRKWEAK